MAQTTYTKSVSGDFSNGAVVATLSQEIQDSAIVTALDYISVGISAADNCDIVFKDSLSAGDVTLLGTVVAAHNGDPLVETIPVTIEGPTADGATVLAPTFEYTAGVHPQWHGHLYNVTAGATNIFDELVTTEKQLRGGWYEMMDNNAVVDDYIEESVVDKDDVLGLFSTYGLTVGVDVLELKKYVKTEYINPLTAGQRQVFVANSTFVIVAGLYTRTIYESTGVTDTLIKVTTLAYE